MTRYRFEASGEGIDIKINLVEDANGHVHVAKKPVEGRAFEYRYLLAADVAEGLEKGDNSACYVYDRIEKKDVCWYVGHCDTDTFAHLIKYLAKWYHDCWTAPEVNNHHGGALVNLLKQIYPYIMYQMDFSKAVDTRRTPVSLGWRTDGVSRSIMLSNLRSILRDGRDGIADAEFFNEALSFIYNNRGREEADSGCKDDRVIAQAIKFQLHNWLPQPRRVQAERQDISDYGGGWRERVIKRKEGAEYV